MMANFIAGTFSPSLLECHTVVMAKSDVGDRRGFERRMAKSPKFEVRCGSVT
jgi:hypothetical protein